MGNDPSTIEADPGAAAFQQFDAEDDQQILAEIQGRNLDILDRMVYSYKDRRGNVVTGLSLTGVRETVREMNRRGLARIKVTPTPPIIRETDDYIEAVIYAEDDLNGGGNWGAKRQAKINGNYDNPFAFEQAISKAQRNAMFGLIPAAHVVEMIREYAEQGRAHPLQTVAQTPKQLRPAQQAPSVSNGAGAPAQPSVKPLGDPSTEAQIKLIRDLLKRNDLDETELLTKLGIDELPELNKQRASQIIDRLLQRAEQSKASS